MELRWYQTYDREGRDSEPTLQFRIPVYPGIYTDWEDVRFVRERETEEVK